MAWSKLVDLELDDESQLDAEMPISVPKAKRAQYPYGLRISLTHEELDKLNLDMPDIGDMIDLRAFAVVTSVSANDGEYGPCCRVELQIEKMSVENEATESPDDESKEV